MKKIKIPVIVSVFLSLCVMSGQAVQFSPEDSNRLTMNFNINWKFNLGDVSGA